ARLFLVESMCIGGVGIAGGLAAGYWIASYIATSLPRFPTGARNLALVAMVFDWRAVAFAIFLGFVISVYGGAWPAWRAVRQPLAMIDRRGGAAAALSSRLSQTILGSAVAVATVIMAGTTFMGIGIWTYLSRPLGFTFQDRFQVSIGPAAGTPPSPPGDWTST